MDLKDEFIYYYMRVSLKKKIQSRKENSWYTQFSKYNSIFIHIPKTAGVSVSVSLVGERNAQISAIQYRALYGKKEFDRCFKFCFVRNPFTRLISAYEFVKSDGPRDKKIVSIVKPYKSFEDFVLNYLNPKTAKTMRYFKPQHYFICDSADRILVDYIGRFETLDKNYEYIREKLGVGEPLKKLNTAETKKRSFEDYYSNKEVLQKVISIYHKDFELFGYSKELPAIL